MDLKEAADGMVMRVNTGEVGTVPKITIKDAASSGSFNMMVKNS